MKRLVATCLRISTAIVVVLFVGGLAQAQEKEKEEFHSTLTAGDLKNNGRITFILQAGGNLSDEYGVDLTLPLDAKKKALAIATGLAKFTDKRGETWKAERVGDSAQVVFKHRTKEQPEEWEEAKFKIGVDSTGEKSTFAMAGPNGGVFDFGIDGSLLAAGWDGLGFASFAEVQTSFGHSHVSIHEHDTADMIINALFNDLLSDGVLIERTSLTSLRLTDFTPDAFMTLQVSDINLPVVNAGVDSLQSVPEPSSFMSLLGGILLLAFPWTACKKKWTTV